MDDDSQEVLGLLARSASEPQQQQLGLPRSRFAPTQLLPGSDPSNSRLPPGLPRAGLSFLGRQPSVQRQHGSGTLGGGGRSFVFGREDSNSALADRGAHGSGEDEPAGPTSFANLKQLAGLGGGQQQQPGGKAGGSSRRRQGPSLVSKLGAGPHRTGKDSLPSSQQALDAANAVCENVVLRGIR